MLPFNKPAYDELVATERELVAMIRVRSRQYFLTETQTKWLIREVRYRFEQEKRQALAGGR